MVEFVNAHILRIENIKGTQNVSDNDLESSTVLTLLRARTRFDFSILKTLRNEKADDVLKNSDAIASCPCKACVSFRNFLCLFVRSNTFHSVSLVRALLRRCFELPWQ